MKKVLVIADALIPTGFARVAHAILGQLADQFEFHHLGISYHGPRLLQPWKIYPTPPENGVYPFDFAEQLITEIDPDLVFIINDIWIINIFAERLKKIAPLVPIVCYTPVDTDPLEPEMVVPLFLNVDHIVTYTNFGKSWILTAAHNAYRETGISMARPVGVIPHGVDRDVFRPITENADPRARRRTAREMLFPDHPSLHDAFIVLNANRNQPRKRIDLTIELFAIFARDKPPNVRLYLHMAREDIAGWHILTLARRYGVLDRLIVPSSGEWAPSVSPSMLNVIYNACEVGLNTCTAEGWGLVAFEHAAAGGAQLLPGHTTQVELWSGAAELMPPCFMTVTERTLGNAYYISPDDGASRLNNLYQDREKLETVASACYVRATSNELNWGVIAESWASIFQNATASRVEVGMRAV
jgi:glycosyltransferase involved in cell wall biosynthesis